MEAAHVQDDWSSAAGLQGVGLDVGGHLFDQLVATWRQRKVSGLLHLLCDADGEERYHTLYMKAAAEAAGLTCKMLVGIEGWTFGPGGRVVDPDGVAFDNVWKTWAWRTVIDGMEEEELAPYVAQAAEAEAPEGGAAASAIRAAQAARRWGPHSSGVKCNPGWLYMAPERVIYRAGGLHNRLVGWSLCQGGSCNALLLLSQGINRHSDTEWRQKPFGGALCDCLTA